MKMALKFESFLWDHGEIEPKSRWFTSTGAQSFEDGFILNFCEEEWTFPMVGNLVHDDMFSKFWVMMLQDWDLSQRLWCVEPSSKLFRKDNGV